MLSIYATSEQRTWYDLAFVFYSIPTPEARVKLLQSLATLMSLAESDVMSNLREHEASVRREIANA